jgi:hypothetical protein
MNPGEGFFGGGDEAFAVGFDQGSFRPSAQAGDGFAAVAAGADDFRHLIGDGLARKGSGSPTAPRMTV